MWWLARLSLSLRSQRRTAALVRGSRCTAAAMFVSCWASAPTEECSFHLERLWRASAAVSVRSTLRISLFQDMLRLIRR
jgi:hypothetical protein